MAEPNGLPCPFCTKLTSIKIRRMDDGTELLAGPGT